MPITESPSYHGYDVTDYRTVESDYGTNEDFKALVAAAHERGMAVIVDLVVNHTSVEHPWFEASAEGDPTYADWYVWDCRPTLGPRNSEIMAWRDQKLLLRDFLGRNARPELSKPRRNRRDGRRRRYWLEDMGADGFRLDALQHIVEEGEEQGTPTRLTHGRAFPRVRRFGSSRIR